MIILYKYLFTKIKMFAKLLIFLSLFQFTDCYYNSSSQCSNYEFVIVDHVEPIHSKNNIIATTKINEDENFMKTKIESYLNKIVKNDTVIIKYIWGVTISLTFVYGYVKFLSYIDYDIVSELFNLND